MMERSLFLFDLDGPLLDVSEKYYRLYNALLSELRMPVLDKKDYWDLKRSKTLESAILAKTNAQDVYPEYSQKRKALIEADEYLKYDLLQPGVVETLTKLSQHFDIALVTLRTNRDKLDKELKGFGVDKFFKWILSAPAEGDTKWRIKYDLIKKEIPARPGKHYFIGDTETDILAGKELGFTSIAITTGIRNPTLLGALEPHYLVDDLQSLFSRQIVTLK